jgi:hypothetical protein
MIGELLQRRLAEEMATIEAGNAVSDRAEGD